MDHVLEETITDLHDLRSIAYNLRELIPCDHLVEVGLLKVVEVSCSVSSKALGHVGDITHVIPYRDVCDVYCDPLLLPFSVFVATVLELFI
jgi:hypothetical protein